MLDERYWFVTGRVDGEKLKTLLETSTGDAFLVSLDIRGDVPKIVIRDNAYDNNRVEVEFDTGPV